MADNLTFNYLNSNQSYPENIDSGNLYFKLISNENENDNKIYNQQHSIEIALDIGNNRYFLTPKMASSNMNGLLSSTDKNIIDNIANIYVQKENFLTEKNVSINIDTENDEAEASGSFVINSDNEVQLNINIPKHLIKGADGIPGGDGAPGKDGDDGQDGAAAIINSTVPITMEGTANPTAAMTLISSDNNEYQLSLNFPDLKGETGENGITPSLGEIDVSLVDGYGNASGDISEDENNPNVYNISISLPKEELRGPKGFQGARGDDATIALGIDRISNPNYNVIDDINVGSGANQSTNLILSGHYSPVIPENTNLNPINPNSLLIKGTNGTYDYQPLNPSVGFLEYLNGAWTYTTTIPVTKGGTGKTSLSTNRILIGNGQNTVNEITNASGALYHDGGNGAPQFGTLPVAQGGTGSSSSLTINALIVGNNNTIKQISSSKGVLQSTGSGVEPNYGTATVEIGGTGLTNFTNNNSILINKKTEDSQNAGVYDYSMAEIQSIAGAFYSTGTNEQPQFGTLPVAQGGTGATTAEQARINLGTMSGYIGHPNTTNTEYYREQVVPTVDSETYEITFDDTNPVKDFCLKIDYVSYYAESIPQNISGNSIDNGEEPEQTEEP